MFSKYFHDIFYYSTVVLNSSVIFTIVKLLYSLIFSQWHVLPGCFLQASASTSLNFFSFWRFFKKKECLSDGNKYWKKLTKIWVHRNVPVSKLDFQSFLEVLQPRLPGLIRVSRPNLKKILPNPEKFCIFIFQLYYGGVERKCGQNIQIHCIKK